jgi:hypothetical protein
MRVAVRLARARLALTALRVRGRRQGQVPAAGRARRSHGHLGEGAAAALEHLEVRRHLYVDEVLCVEAELLAAVQDCEDES